MQHHFQYQSLAEPLSTSPETPQLDKWFQPASEPVREPDPLPSGAMQSFAIGSLDSNTFQPPFSWVPQGAGPVFGGRLTQYQGRAEPLFTEPAPEIPLDSWWQPASEPVRVPDPLVPEGRFTIDLDLLTRDENVLLDKWWQPTSEPVREIPLLHASQHPHWWGVLHPDLFVVTTPYGWWVQPSEPVRQGPSPFVSEIAQGALAIPPSISVVVTCVEFRDGAFSRITFDAESLDGLRFTDDMLSRVTFTSEEFC